MSQVGRPTHIAAEGHIPCCTVRGAPVSLSLPDPFFLLLPCSHNGRWSRVNLGPHVDGNRVASTPPGEKRENSYSQLSLPRRGLQIIVVTSQACFSRTPTQSPFLLVTPLFYLFVEEREAISYRTHPLHSTTTLYMIPSILWYIIYLLAFFAVRLLLFSPLKNGN